MRALILLLLAATPAYAQYSFPPVAGSSTPVVTPVSAITSGLTHEYHLTITSGTSLPDYAGGSPAIISGPATLGGVVGGITLSGAGIVTLPADTATAITFQAYTCMGSQTQSSYPALFGADHGTNGLIQFLLVGPLTGTTGFNLGLVYNSSLAGETGSTYEGCHLVTWTRDATSDHYYIDGSESPYYIQTPYSSSTLPADGGYGVGNMPTEANASPGASTVWPYPLYYVATYSRELSPAEVAATYSSISNWVKSAGVAAVTPALYSDPTPQILVVGDSRDSGYNATHPYSYYIAPTATYSVANIATPGWQYKAILTECPTRGLAAEGVGTDTVIIGAGGNDLDSGNGVGVDVSPATAIARLQRVVSCYKALPSHPRVYVSTTPSGNRTGWNNETGDQLADAYNALLRQSHAGAEGLIDFTSYPGIGGDSAWNNTTYPTACGGGVCFTSDQIHLDDAGLSIEGAMVNAYINYRDAVAGGSVPKLITAATYTETSADVAVVATPTAASQTITLPVAYGITGTTRYVRNGQSTGANTVTVSLPSTDGTSSTYVCPNATTCTFMSVLGAQPGAASKVNGAHWERQ